MMSSKLNELQTLLSKIPGDEVCCLEEVHGMLTAMIIGPFSTMPSEWIPYVFSKKGEMPVFDSTKTPEKLMQLLIEINNEIIAHVDAKDFAPLLKTKYTKDEKQNIIRWCSGFLRGMIFWGDEWFEEGEDDNEIGSLLGPVFYFVDDEETGKKSRIGKTKNEILALEKQMVDFIGPCVWEIREYWRTWIHKGAIQLNNHLDKHIKEVKVGRNEQCLCGSGKKYKNCCGKWAAN